jgi:hypothetical protein
VVSKKAYRRGDNDNLNAESTTNMKDWSKVVTASELAGFDENDAYAGNLTAAAITLSGSKSSTIEAIAIFDNSESADYFNATSGDQYPALIKTIEQKIVSGSDSKYIFTVEAYINGAKKTYSTEEKTYSNFLDMLEGFSSAQETKNRMAWIKLNSNDEVTKIVAADNDANVGEDNVYTSTRAIISSKTAKGLSYIANWPTTSSSTTNYKAYIIEDKVGQSDYAAYAADCAFYTINVHPANNDITNSVKKSIDGDYSVEVGSSSSVLTSTINGKSTDIYYAADLFFNDDGDIMAVYMYTKNVDVASTTAPEIKDITYTSTNATSAADNFVSNSADVAVNDDLTFTVTYPTSGAVVKLNGTTVDPTEAGGNTYKVDTTTKGTFEYTITAENCNDLTLTANVGVKALTADAQVGGVSVAGDEVATGSSVTFSATDKNGATVSGITVKDSTGATVTNPLPVSALGEATYTVSADGYTDADVSFTVVNKTMTATVKNGSTAMAAETDGSYLVKTTDTVTVELTDGRTAVTTASVGSNAVSTGTYAVNDVTTEGSYELTFTADGYDDVTVTINSYDPSAADAELIEDDAAVTNDATNIAVGDTITAALKSTFTAPDYVDADFQITTDAGTTYTALADWTLDTRAVVGSAMTITLHDANDYYNDVDISTTALVVKGEQTATVKATAGETTFTIEVADIDDLNAASFTITIDTDKRFSPVTLAAKATSVNGNVVTVSVVDSNGDAAALDAKDVIKVKIAAGTNYDALAETSYTVSAASAS